MHPPPKTQATQGNSNLPNLMKGEHMNWAALEVTHSSARSIDYRGSARNEAV